MRDPDEQQHLIEQATQWLVLLRSGQAEARDHLAFQAWRRADPRHEQLCQRLENTLGVFQVPRSQGVDGRVVQRALAAPSGRRRFLQRALFGAGVVVGAGLIGNPMSGLHLGADLSTSTGERQTLSLPDGSQLVLNAQSQADVRFDSQLRVLEWRGGEGLLTVVDESRPFLVRIEDSTVSARSARLLVAERAGQCRVSIASVELLRPGEGAWVDGLLEVRDSPLSEVVDALRPYRRGVLRLDPAVAGLRVSGLFRLDQSELVFEALARTLPIRVSRHGEYWLSIGAV